MAVVVLSIAVAALFAVLVPIHVAVYGTVLPLALILGAALCGAPLVAIVQPGIAIGLFCGAAFFLPLLGPTYPAAHLPRILMLTTFDIDDYVYDALLAGASGFLLKDAVPEELVHAVRVIAAGEALLAPSVTRRLISRFAAQKPRASRGSALLANLTEREREVLDLIGQGRSNSEIAASLFIAEQTVKTHVGKVLAKINARDRVQAVSFAYDTGLAKPS